MICSDYLQKCVCRNKFLIQIGPFKILCKTWCDLHGRDIRNIARIANAVPVTLYSRVTVNVKIVVLNCQKCNQCLKGHKSLETCDP